MRCAANNSGDVDELPEAVSSTRTRPAEAGRAARVRTAGALGAYRYRRRLRDERADLGVGKLGRAWGMVDVYCLHHPAAHAPHNWLASQKQLLDALNQS
jgi:hypothetical protein